MSEPETDTLPPSDPEVEAFDAVCRRLGGFDERIETEWADGFLTAVVAGPRKIDMDEWLPALSGDAFDRAFADPSDIAQATQALRAREQRLRRALDPEALLDDEESILLAPLMHDWDDAARAELVAEGMATAEEAAQVHTGAAWGEGFFAALSAFADDWPDPAMGDDFREAYGAMLQTIAALVWDPAGEEFKAFAAKGWKGESPTRDELIDEVCYAVQDLRLYWLDHAPKPPPRRVDAVPGRNDPCPCGSGKKYKKCHGAGE
jgi:uncharacterized protein